MQLYESYKIVKIGCRDCRGCSACCSGMGASIILDPFDLYQLQKGLGMQPQAILEQYGEFQMQDGLILPNLKMAGERDQCSFLSQEGRCSIHDFRPGLCRLFPLGRNYEDGKMSYFILEDACQAPGDRTKVRIARWIGLDNVEAYEQFLTTWHYFLKERRQKITTLPPDEWESGVKNVSLNILNRFYLNPYDCAADFYEQFEARMMSL